MCDQNWRIFPLFIQELPPGDYRKQNQKKFYRKQNQKKLRKMRRQGCRV